VRTLVTLACITALAIAAAPAGAAPVGGMAKPGAGNTNIEQTPPTVIRELHTVVRERDAGRTLAVVLAATALGIATLSGGYSTLRVRRLRQQV
jgi:hypothetical protein